MTHGFCDCIIIIYLYSINTDRVAVCGGPWAGFKRSETTFLNIHDPNYWTNYSHNEPMALVRPQGPGPHGLGAQGPQVRGANRHSTPIAVGTPNRISNYATT